MGSGRGATIDCSAARGSPSVKKKPTPPPQLYHPHSIRTTTTALGYRGWFDLLLFSPYNYSAYGRTHTLQVRAFTFDPITRHYYYYDYCCFFFFWIPQVPCFSLQPSAYNATSNMNWYRSAPFSPHTRRVSEPIKQSCLLLLGE